MDEAELSRVEGEPFGVRVGARKGPGAIRVIAEDRVPPRGQVDADLVRAPRFEPRLEVGGGDGGEALEDPVARHGPFALPRRADGHADAVARVAPERRAD